MKQWEYRVSEFSLISTKDVAASLNSLGLEGWEVAGIATNAGKEGRQHLIILKRPIGEGMDDDQRG